MTEHSEVNIPLAGLYTVPQDLNKTVVGTNRTKYLPRSINLGATPSATVINVSGQWEYSFCTSNNQWLDLFSSHFFTRYTTSVVGAAVAGQDNQVLQQITQNLIGSAYLYVNGIQVAYTNNWSVSSQVNKRIQFSKTYNKTMNQVNYDSDVTLVAGIAALAAVTAGGSATIQPGFPMVGDSSANAATRTDTEYLDGFFIRDRDSCWIPPNSEVRIVCIADAAALGKATKNGTAAGINTYLINSIEFIANSVFRSDPVPEDYVLKLITNQITSSSVAADCNRSLTVDPNITKVAIVFQSGDFATQTVANKVWGGCQLAYSGQNNRTFGTAAVTGVAGAEQLNNLQLQLGSIVMPPQAYDFATNLFKEAYDDYLVSTNKLKSFESQESYLDWLTEPIYLFNIPRPINDKSTNLIIRARRTSGGPLNPLPLMHIIEMDEQLISFKYDPKTSACIATTTLK